jgi:hypothetical protein
MRSAACCSAARRLLPAPLELLLQPRLGVLERGGLGQPGQRVAHEPGAGLARGGEAAVEVDRAEHGLERIGQDGGVAEAAGAHRAGSQHQDVAEPERFGQARQAVFAHQARAQLREVAFAGPRAGAVQGLAGDEVDQGVAEELQSFVVGGARRGTVRQRLRQQLRVAERVAEPALEALAGLAAHSTAPPPCIGYVFWKCAPM